MFGLTPGLITEEHVFPGAEVCWTVCPAVSVQWEKPIQKSPEVNGFCQGDLPRLVSLRRQDPVKKLSVGEAGLKSVWGVTSGDGFCRKIGRGASASELTGSGESPR